LKINPDQQQKSQVISSSQLPSTQKIASKSNHTF